MTITRLKDTLIYNFDNKMSEKGSKSAKTNRKTKNKTLAVAPN
jgi:hypothetical protein